MSRAYNNIVEKCKTAKRFILFHNTPLLWASHCHRCGAFSYVFFIRSSFLLGRCTVTGMAPIYFHGEKCMATTNPRYKNGNLRRKHRARFKAMQAPCGICRGKLGPIHYDEPSDAQHPFSFVIDEIKPVSKWRFYGYDSPEAAAQDWSNLQAAHYICNARKGAKTIRKRIISDGSW